MTLDEEVRRALRRAWTEFLRGTSRRQGDSGLRARREDGRRRCIYAPKRRHGASQMVRKWRQRFVQRRLDEPRPGPRRISAAKIEQVIVRTLETKPSDGTH